MKRLIFILVFLAVFLTTAIFAYRHPITITINSQQFIVEFPLLVGVIAFLSIHFLLLFLNRLFSLPKHWQQILLQYRRKKAVYYLNLAAQQLVLNEPFTKLKSLVAYAPYSPLPIWHYWLAAQGALNQHDFKNCQLYLQKARFLSNIDSTLLDLSTATLLLKQELPSEAINYLIRCLKQHPAAINVLTLLLETYCKQRSWRLAAELIASAGKRFFQLQLPKRWESLAITIYKNYFPTITSTKNLEKIWTKLPATIQTQPVIAKTYLETALKFGETKLAQKILLKLLQKQLTPELLDFYADFPTDHPENLQKQAEIWLKMAPQLPELYLTLAKLALRQKLYGQARTYLDHGYKLCNHPEIFDKLRIELMNIS